MATRRTARRQPEQPPTLAAVVDHPTRQRRPRYTTLKATLGRSERDTLVVLRRKLAAQIDSDDLPGHTLAQLVGRPHWQRIGSAKPTAASPNVSASGLLNGHEPASPNRRCWAAAITASASAAAAWASATAGSASASNVSVSAAASGTARTSACAFASPKIDTPRRR
jgi:hypothetical protein